MKIQSTKIPVTIIDDSFLQNEIVEKKNWRLIRDNDVLTKESVSVTWVEWSEDGRGKATHDDIDIGRSFLMSPFSIAFTWQTTSVTEIVVMEENFIKFKTKNSAYTLTKIN
jgi:hypothetical protein